MHLTAEGHRRAVVVRVEHSKGECIEFYVLHSEHLCRFHRTLLADLSHGLLFPCLNFGVDASINVRLPPDHNECSTSVLSTTVLSPHFLCLDTTGQRGCDGS
jgi:hypothetical protein